MSNLTIEKLREMAALLPKSDYDSFLLRPLPLRIFDAPAPQPKVQLRQIYLKDGTPLLPPAFLAAQNAKWAALFGYHEDIFKDKAYILGNYGVVMKTEYRRMITSIVS